MGFNGSTCTALPGAHRHGHWGGCGRPDAVDPGGSQVCKHLGPVPSPSPGPSRAATSPVPVRAHRALRLECGEHAVDVQGNSCLGALAAAVTGRTEGSGGGLRANTPETAAAAAATSAATTATATAPATAATTPATPTITEQLLLLLLPLLLRRLRRRLLRLLRLLLLLVNWCMMLLREHHAGCTMLPLQVVRCRLVIVAKIDKRRRIHHRRMVHRRPGAYTRPLFGST